MIFLKESTCHPPLWWGPPSLSAMAIAYVGGIAARSERYMRTHWDFAKGFLAQEVLETAAAEEETAWVAAQKAAGLDLLSPAYARWEDLLRPLWAPGVAVDDAPLSRYFETNTFFRRPLVGTRLPIPDPAAWFAAFQVPAGAGWVLSLPSPWDFALRSGAERPREAALEAAGALRKVVDAAFLRGCRLVRFQDPSLAYARAGRRDIDTALDGLREAAGRHARDATLHLTNGDPWTVPHALQGNPLGGLSVEDPGHAPPAGLSLPAGTRLTAAVVRGEESLVEDPAATAAAAQELARRLGVGLWGVTNGWDLDHVPHAIALRKLGILARTRDALQVVAA